jgi:hypothetical protein
LYKFRRLANADVITFKTVTITSTVSRQAGMAEKPRELKAQKLSKARMLVGLHGLAVSTPAMH